MYRRKRKKLIITIEELYEMYRWQHFVLPKTEEHKQSAVVESIISSVLENETIWKPLVLLQERHKTKPIHIWKFEKFGAEEINLVRLFHYIDEKNKKAENVREDRKENNLFWEYEVFVEIHEPKQA